MFGIIFQIFFFTPFRYVQGNHDSALTAQDAAKFFDAGCTHFHYVPGPVRFDDILICHGHEFDAFNASDLLNRPAVVSILLFILLTISGLLHHEA